MPTEYQLLDKENYMDYHLFKKSVKSKSKIVRRWYYYYIDPVLGKKIQKVCKNCKTQAEAFSYVSSLPKIYDEEITVGKIAKYMFVPGSEHMERMEKLGKKITVTTLRIKRELMRKITEEFGSLSLEELTVPVVTNYLISLGDTYSASWKNNFITAVGNIFDEAPFAGLPFIQKPVFPKFKRNSKKADILTAGEEDCLFDENVWIQLEKELYEKKFKPIDNYRSIYLMFLVIASCGLRLGEAIAIRKKQFLLAEKTLVVDGFYQYESGIRTNYNKKGSNDDRKIRVVPLPDSLCKTVQDFISESNFYDDDYVFTRSGKPIRPKTAEKWFSRALKIAGIETDGRKLVPHSLRYTYITRMRGSVSGETVRKLAGHTTIGMTDYYTRASLPEMISSVEGARATANVLIK